MIQAAIRRDVAYHLARVPRLRAVVELALLVLPSIAFSSLTLSAT